MIMDHKLSHNSNKYVILIVSTARYKINEPANCHGYILQLVNITAGRQAGRHTSTANFSRQMAKHNNYYLQKRLTYDESSHSSMGGC